MAAAAAETWNMVESLLECARHEHEVPKKERSVTSPQKSKGKTLDTPGEHAPGPGDGGGQKSARFQELKDSFQG